MKLSRSTLSVALLAAVVAPAAHAEIALDVIGGSEISFEGLVQADYNDFNSDFANLNGDSPDGTSADNEMRRAELVLKGKGPGNFEWVIGYDAKADKWLDVNAKYKLGGNGNHFFQLGQFKQPNSLEELSSTKNNDFISKAMVTNTFGVARRLGAAYRYGDNDWGVTASYFTRELTEHPAPTPHGPGYGVRGNWAPLNDKGSILHFGLSYVDYDTFQDTVRLRARPDADLAGQRLVDTGNMTNADRQKTIGGEAMWVTGPVKLQGEYMQSKVERYFNGNALQSHDFDGNSWYVSGLWNITGETWGYKDGVPTTPLPDNPGSGMWQVGLRYDTIDLNDGTAIPGTTPTAASRVDGVLGGEMDTWTVGVNWYWRSNFKFMLNYVKVDSSRYFVRTPAAPYAVNPADNNVLVNREIDDNPDILEARVQFYW
ncbi:phosphate-selective porin OprO/OprP [Lysobacter niastensis]|uniref:Phosphate-selective porin OprO/OprP n=1 Tax=Lysobacter niastensis TaxID=380629 RepID=A0ABU1W921_9GAMM|nr:OprO/OprP family phosphate-selective porin [Lysobacter niastensis]MDR7134111.1 phosphate-selective porin OprO/OprP [Lysobacter niastensis]